jgi:hypothetical protein
MNALLALTLLCPDTTYFRETFTVRLEWSEPAPPGTPKPDAWEARSGLAGIVGEGKLPPGADSVLASVAGPGAYLEDGARVSIEVGTYDRAKGQIKAIPGAGCMTVMKVRKPTAVAALPLRAGKKARPAILPRFTLDGRVRK